MDRDLFTFSCCFDRAVFSCCSYRGDATIWFTKKNGNAGKVFFEERKIEERSRAKPEWKSSPQFADVMLRQTL